MSFKSNFTNVRISDDHKTLRVSGTSDDSTEVKEIHITLAAAPEPSALALPGSELVPLDSQLQTVIPKAKVQAEWAAEIKVAADTFKPDQQVLVAGVAMRPTEPDVWLSSSTILKMNAPK
jgi:hypothetical protein